jgi:hypothetical protein
MASKPERARKLRREQTFKGFIDDTLPDPAAARDYQIPQIGLTGTGPEPPGNDHRNPPEVRPLPRQEFPEYAVDNLFRANTLRSHQYGKLAINRVRSQL